MSFANEFGTDVDYLKLILSLVSVFRQVETLNLSPDQKQELLVKLTLLARGVVNEVTAIISGVAGAPVPVTPQVSDEPASETEQPQ